MKTFEWNTDALIPNSITIDFGPILHPGETVAPDLVTFYEMPKNELISFVDESLGKKVVTEETVTDENGEPVIENGKVKTTLKNRPFKDVEAEHSQYLFKFLSIACRNAKSEAWFAEQQFPVSTMSGLTDMLLQLNQIEEVMASAGNWLVLPTIQKLFGETAALPENKDDTVLQPTTQA